MEVFMSNKTGKLVDHCITFSTSSNKTHMISFCIHSKVHTAKIDLINALLRPLWEFTRFVTSGSWRESILTSSFNKWYGVERLHAKTVWLGEKYGQNLFALIGSDYILSLLMYKCFKTCSKRVLKDQWKLFFPKSVVIEGGGGSFKLQNHAESLLRNGRQHIFKNYFGVFCSAK